MYDIILKQLENRNKPIDVIVVGLGFMGFGFLSYSRSLKGIRVPLLITRRPSDSKQFLEQNGFNVVIESNQNRIKDYASRGYICISDDLDVIKRFENSIVFEVTGSVSYGAEVALEVIKAGKHLVTMNPELQATVGTELKAIADNKNVVITDVVGDQPGSIAHLISKAKLMGFKVRMAGSMEKDEVKQPIELNLVGNYFGMGVIKRGMVGPEVSNIRDVLTKFEWDKIPERGVVDYAIGKSLFPGAFLVAEHKDPNQQKYLSYLGLGDGPRYVLFDTYHLCHLEVVQTISKVALFGEATINNSLNPVVKTITIAKQDLLKGQKLDEVGRDTVCGMVDNISACQDLLPVGLARDAIVKHDIAKDTPIKISDVILPLNCATVLSGLVKLQQKSSFLGFIFRTVNIF